MTRQGVIGTKFLREQAVSGISLANKLKQLKQDSAGRVTMPKVVLDALVNNIELTCHMFDELALDCESADEGEL